MRTKDSQLGDIEQDILIIDHEKKIGIKEVLIQNERQSLKLKTEI